MSYGNSVNFYKELFFDEQYYIEQKVNSLNTYAYEGKTDWTYQSTVEAMANAGMTPWEHFVKYGAYEKAADGTLGIDPSAYFDLDLYYASAAKSLETSTTAFIDSLKVNSLDPITHYATKGYCMTYETEDLDDNGKLTYVKHSLDVKPVENEILSNNTRLDYYKLFYFSEDEYLQNKVESLNTYDKEKTWTIESTVEAMANCGMTPWEHFVKFGAYEEAADGSLGIDPSQYFDISDYYNQLAKKNNQSVSDVVSSMKSQQWDPITHYSEKGYVDHLYPLCSGRTGIH